MAKIPENLRGEFEIVRKNLYKLLYSFVLFIFKNVDGEDRYDTSYKIYLEVQSKELVANTMMCNHSSD